jgi:hypothetical protein
MMEEMLRVSQDKNGRLTNRKAGWLKRDDRLPRSDEGRYRED